MESVTESGRKGEPDGRDRVKVHLPEIGATVATAGFTTAGSDLARGTGSLAAGSDLAAETGLLAAGGGWEAGGVIGGA
jgi:hypothetical protein